MFKGNVNICWNLFHVCVYLYLFLQGAKPAFACVPFFGSKVCSPCFHNMLIWFGPEQHGNNYLFVQKSE